MAKVWNRITDQASLTAQASQAIPFAGSCEFVAVPRSVGSALAFVFQPSANTSHCDDRSLALCPIFPPSCDTQLVPYHYGRLSEHRPNTACEDKAHHLRTRCDHSPTEYSFEGIIDVIRLASVRISRMILEWRVIYVVGRPVARGNVKVFLAN